MRAIALACCGLALAATVEAQGGGTWETKSPMSQIRCGTAAATVGGTVYAIGGMSTWDVPVGPVEAYDPATGVWTLRSPMQNPRWGHAVAALEDKVYAIGGYYGGGGYASTVNEYTPATDTWRTRASLPGPRVAPAAAALNGKVYAFGGRAHPVTYRTLHEYDPTTNVWTEKANMHYGRYGGAGAALDGRIYALGGHDESGTPQASAEVYDPASNTWHDIAPMPVRLVSPAVAAINGKLYVFGGHNGPDSLASVEEYDPRTDTWRSVTAMPTARHGAGVSLADGRAYVIGGCVNVGGTTRLPFLKVVEEYAPPAAALQLTKTTVTGCLNATAKVTLSEPAPAGGLTVTLHSDNPAAVVPASVTMKAGATKKSFTIETSAVAAHETATIEASLPGGVASAALTLTPMGVKSVSLTPNPVVGGNLVAGTVTLPCPAGPGDIEVALTSTKAFIAEPTTDTILVPVGTQSFSFDVRTTPVFALVDLAIKATANDVTKSKKLTMNPAP